LRKQFGLDSPLYEQFFRYAKAMVTFDFGLSFLSQRPVWEELRSRLPNTVFLLGSAFLLSAILGTWLGIHAARRRGSFLEKIVLLAGSVSF
ncbi:glutathione ABC transporter permease GsiC, partial [Klebsiella pneumoniae]|nr:glutathione ABC transporter permease GsiC [Klebsiella pneumoniae]